MLFKFLAVVNQARCYLKFQLVVKKMYIFSSQTPKMQRIVGMDTEANFRTIVASGILRKTRMFKKRVTCILSAPTYLIKVKDEIALVEFVGSNQVKTIHDNAKCDEQYFRTRPATLEKISQELQQKKPREVYNDFLLQDKELVQTPRNLCQLYSKKHNDKKTKNNHNGPVGNLADRMLRVVSLCQQEPMVRSVNFTSNSIDVTIFSDDQISDIKRFCCTGRTPLTVDKTFNLCEIHVTVTTFKNLSVTNKTTGEPPIMLGPLYIHSSSSAKCYNQFFSLLSGALNNVDTKLLTIGTDDEKAMRKSISENFPDSTNIICSRHLKSNVEEFMKNKVGLNVSERRRINETIFGRTGIITTEKEESFEKKTLDLLHNTENPSLRNYLVRRVLPLIKKGIFCVTKNKQLSAHWTNNNTESMNHVLKHMID
uniref:uncharacterized protein LOC120341177 isoform X1 n=1 Tax=Styela clava TaxID=7725 RepID=UPI00193A26EC|nr:uncharacterized protein LOC120341177 isoform X1 [Styela clava]